MNVKSSLRGPITPQNMGRTCYIFCFVSNISTKILFLWKMLKKHWRLKNILLLGIALIYGVAISGRRINSVRKKVLFLKNFYYSPEKNSLRGEHILLTLFNNTIHCTSRNNQGPFAKGKIRWNNKLAAFWCVFLTKIKVDPESW